MDEALKRSEALLDIPDAQDSSTQNAQIRRMTRDLLDDLRLVVVNGSGGCAGGEVREANQLDALVRGDIDQFTAHVHIEGRGSGQKVQLEGGAVRRHGMKKVQAEG